MTELRTIVAPNGGPFTLDGTRTFVVGRRRVAIVDPGPDSEDHVRRVADESRAADQIVILVSHDHRDHAGGAARLSRLLGAPLVGPVDGARSVHSGDAFETDVGSLVAVPTPGHASPHWSFHWLEESAVFVGDLLLGRGSTTWVGAYPGCVADYLASLDRIDGLEAAVLYPAHGPPLSRAPEAVERFRAHRLDRLDQLRALRRSRTDASPEELARELYGMSPDDDLHGAGVRSVEAMLHHLKDEG